ncbi:MAG: glycosyltransferase family 10 [Methylococcales bacterium]|nr:glycosyltransferase family 10 [Methylococcales bacterium]
MTDSTLPIAWLLNLEEQPGNLIPCPHEGIGLLLKEKLEQAGYLVKTGNSAANLGNFAVLISADLDEQRVRQVAAYPRERCFLIATEPPAVAPLFHSPIVKERFGKIFTLLQKYVDNETYVKIHHLVLQKDPVSAIEEVPFEQKKLCCMIQANKFFYPDPGELYSERQSLAISFTQLTTYGEEFHLYGPGWQGLPSWKGIANTNKTIIKDYKFTVCYENSYDQPGYITERIFNSLISRNVPIYLGAPDILDYVPKECFIDARDFGGRGSITHQKIWQFIKTMDKTTYTKYIQVGQDYLANHPKYQCFSVENIVNTIMGKVYKLSRV